MLSCKDRNLIYQKEVILMHSMQQMAALQKVRKGLQSEIRPFQSSPEGLEIVFIITLTLAAGFRVTVQGTGR